VTGATELLGDWLDNELEEVPQELAVRIRAALPPDWRVATVIRGASVLADAAATELRGLLERGCDTRWAAPGLLTVDALVTYACELLAYCGADIDADSSRILDTVLQTLTPRGSVA
jgi:hypothetical protein